MLARPSPSYRQPLNVTDAAIGPDGALYSLRRRRTQSGSIACAHRTADGTSGAARFPRWPTLAPCRHKLSWRRLPATRPPCRSMSSGLISAAPTVGSGTPPASLSKTRDVSQWCDPPLAENGNPSPASPPHGAGPSRRLRLPRPHAQPVCTDSPSPLSEEQQLLVLRDYQLAMVRLARSTSRSRRPAHSGSMPSIQRGAGRTIISSASCWSISRRRPPSEKRLPSWAQERSRFAALPLFPPQRRRGGASGSPRLFHRAQSSQTLEGARDYQRSLRLIALRWPPC